MNQAFWNAFEEKKNFLIKKLPIKALELPYRQEIVRNLYFYILYQDFDLAQELLITMFGTEEEKFGSFS